MENPAKTSCLELQRVCYLFKPLLKAWFIYQGQCKIKALQVSELEN